MGSLEIGTTAIEKWHIVTALNSTHISLENVLMAASND